MPQPSIAPLAPLTCRASTAAARCRRDHCCSAPRRAAPRSSGEGLREWLTSGRCSDHADARCSSAVRGTPSLAELATLRPTGFAPTVREAPVELQRRRPLRSKRQLLGISSACVCRSPPQIPCVRFPPHPATCRHGSSPEPPCLAFGPGLASTPYRVSTQLQVSPHLKSSEVTPTQTPRGARSQTPRRRPSASLCGASPSAKQTRMTASLTSRKLINTKTNFRNLHV